MAHSRKTEFNGNELGLLPDEHIWEAIRQHQKNAFDYVYKKYIAVLYNYGRQISADGDLVKDCVQDVFVGIWQAGEKLGKTNVIKFYLFTSLRRKIIEAETRNSKIAARQYRYQGELTDKIGNSAEHTIIQKEKSEGQEEAVRKALENISSRQKEVLFLLYYHNMSYEEVAAIMQISTRSVYTLAWKATQSLKKELNHLHPTLFPLLLCLFFLVGF